MGPERILFGGSENDGLAIRGKGSIASGDAKPQCHRIRQWV